MTTATSTSAPATVVALRCLACGCAVGKWEAATATQGIGIWCLACEPPPAERGDFVLDPAPVHRVHYGPPRLYVGQPALPGKARFVEIGPGRFVGMVHDPIGGGKGMPVAEAAVRIDFARNYVPKFGNKLDRAENKGPIEYGAHELKACSYCGMQLNRAVYDNGKGTRLCATCYDIDELVSKRQLDEAGAKIKAYAASMELRGKMRRAEEILVARAGRDKCSFCQGKSDDPWFWFKGAHLCEHCYEMVRLQDMGKFHEADAKVKEHAARIRKEDGIPEDPELDKAFNALLELNEIPDLVDKFEELAAAGPPPPDLPPLEDDSDAMEEVD